MSIVILAPYQRSDATWSALRLANWLLAIGKQVIYVATRRSPGALHAYWDSRVRGLQSSNSYLLARAASLIVVYDPDEAVLALVDLLELPPAQVLVACPSLLHHLPEQRWRSFPTIVGAPSVIRSLQQHWAQKPLAKQQFRACVWDAGVTPVVRDGLRADGQLRLLVVLDTPTVKGPGVGFWRSLVSLRRALPDLQLSVATSCRLPVAQRELAAQCAEGGFACSWQRWRDWESLWQLAHQHDLVAYLALRYDTTALLSRLLAVGAPLVAWDHPVSAEVVTADCGWRLPCMLETGHYGWSSVVPNWQSWSDFLLQLQHCPTSVVKRQPRSWPAAWEGVWWPLVESS